jgi:iron(III) transport system ATP-binding protein
MAELLCQAIYASYRDRRVLSGVDLSVGAGTLTAILGASGSGKTTLLRVIMGFVAADAGSVTLGSTVVAEPGRVHVPPNQRAIAYVAQEGALFPHLDVAANVGFGLPRSERQDGTRVGEVLDLVGLDQSYASRRPHELSGGEQRRVALARALAPRPAVVLLDEPFSGLDAALRAETRTAVVSALAGAGATALLVTHDQREALSTGHEVAVLRDGQLVQTAPPEIVYRTPADLDVAHFVGEAVVVPGEARGEAVVCTLGTLPIRGEPVVGKVHVMIRPEQIQLSQVAGDGGIAGEIVSQTFYGPESILHLALGDSSRTVVTARTFDGAVARLGDAVTLHVDGAVTVYQTKPAQR